MPGKPNDALKPKHVFVAGGTGSGKTAYIKHNSEMSSAKIRLLWDPDKSHRCYHIATVQGFFTAVRNGIKSGKKLNLGLSVDCTEENFQQFCKIVWAACCSTRPMVVIVEEVGDVTNAGKARGVWGELLRKSRKYGVQVVAVCQRPQEIDKTTLSQCGTKVCAALERHADRVVMAKELSVAIEDIEKLERLNGEKAGTYSLHYLIKEPGKPTVPTSITGRKTR